MKTLLILTWGFIFQAALSQENKLTISGQVIDSVSAEPLPNVNVIIRGEMKGTTTDSLGRFRIDLALGIEHILVFSHIGYHKTTRKIVSNRPGEVEHRVILAPRSIALGEVVVTAKRRFILNEYATRRASFRIGGEEFERLGEPDMERAMIHLLPFVVQPLRDRMRLNTNDFTLYINGEWKESIFLDEIDPFSVRRVFVWEGLGRDLDNRHDIFPIGLPLRRGRYVVLVETN